MSQQIVVKKIRRFAPEMAAIRDHFSRRGQGGDLPQLTELLGRMLEQHAISVEQVEELAAVVPPVPLLDVLKSGALVGARMKVNFTEDGNVILTIADDAVNGRVNIGIKAVAGTEIPPFTCLWEWNRTDFSQFTVEEWPGATPGQSAADKTRTSSIVSVPASAAVYTVPYGRVDIAGGGGPHMLYCQYRTAASYSPAAGQLLMVHLEFSGIPPSQTGRLGAGFIFAKNGTPLSDFYLFGFTSAATWVAWKIIGGTAYQQCSGTFANGPASYQYGAGARRATFTIDTAGKLTVYDGGMLTMEMPMTVGEATVITNGYVGFSPTGGSANVLYNMRIYAVPAAWRAFIP